VWGALCACEPPTTEPHMDTQTRICHQLRHSRHQFMLLARNYRHRAIKTAKAYTLAYLEQKAYWL